MTMGVIDTSGIAEAMTLGDEDCAVEETTWLECEKLNTGYGSYARLWSSWRQERALGGWWLLPWQQGGRAPS